MVRCNHYLHSTVILREYFKNIPLKFCNIARILQSVRKVSKILQEPCNVRSKHNKCNVAAILLDFLDEWVEITTLFDTSIKLLSFIPLYLQAVCLLYYLLSTGQSSAID